MNASSAFACDKQPADVPARHVADPRVVDLVPEEVLVVCSTATGACACPLPLSMNSGFGMNVTVLPLCVRGVLDDVLVLQHVVRGLQQRVVAHVDLGLTGRADLVVMHLDLDADLLEVQDHLAAQVLVLVHRRDGEVPLLVARLVAEVRAAGIVLAAGVPDAFERIDVVVALVLVLVEPDRVEDVELGLRAPVRDVGDPGLFQVQLGLLRDVARVAAVHLAGHRVLHEAVDVQRRVLRERIQVRGVRHRAPIACPTPGSPGTRGSTNRRTRSLPRRSPPSAPTSEPRSAASVPAGRRTGDRRSGPPPPWPSPGRPWRSPPFLPPYSSTMPQG